MHVRTAVCTFSLSTVSCSVSVISISSSFLFTSTSSSFILALSFSSSFFMMLLTHEVKSVHLLVFDKCLVFLTLSILILFSSWSSWFSSTTISSPFSTIPITFSFISATSEESFVLIAECSSLPRVRFPNRTASDPTTSFSTSFPTTDVLKLRRLFALAILPFEVRQTDTTGALLVIDSLE